MFAQLCARYHFSKKRAQWGELSGARIFILSSHFTYFTFFFLGYRFRHGVPNVTGILFGYELSISVEIDCREHEILILEACPPFNLGSFFKMKEKKRSTVKFLD
jgi:hypothetical protein